MVENEISVQVSKTSKTDLKNQVNQKLGSTFPTLQEYIEAWKDKHFRSPVNRVWSIFFKGGVMVLDLTFKNQLDTTKEESGFMQGISNEIGYLAKSSAKAGTAGKDMSGYHWCYMVGGKVNKATWNGYEFPILESKHDNSTYINICLGEYTSHVCTGDATFFEEDDIDDFLEQHYNEAVAAGTELDMSVKTGAGIIS